MAYAFVKKSTAGVSAGASSLGSSFATLPSTGNLIVVTVEEGNNGANVTSQGSVSDNQGNTYASAKYLASGLGFEGVAAGIYWAIVTGTPSGTFTVTYATGGSQSNSLVVEACEYSGNASSSPVDKTAGGAGSLGISPQTTGTTGTLGSSGDLSVTACVTDNQNTPNTFTVPTGYTSRVNSTANFAQGNSADLVLSASTAINPSWSWNQVEVLSVAIVATFLPSASSLPPGLGPNMPLQTMQFLNN